MRCYLTFLRYELLMHVKSWRLWLCLAALLAVAVPWREAVSLGADPAMLDRIAGYALRHGAAAAAFFFPMIILIAIDAVARVRATGVQPLLFVKPFSPLPYVLASWTAVVLLAGGLGGVALLARQVVCRYVLGLDLSPAPFALLLLLAALPATIALAALVFWVRIVFKDNVTAYLLSAILAAALFFTASQWRLPLLGWNLELAKPLLGYYVASIGRDLDWAYYGAAFLNTGLLSVLFLVLSCYHLRRREPQRKVLGDYGKKWSDMPTFLGLPSDLKLDRHVGLAVHVVFLATVVSASTIGVRSIRESRDEAQQIQRWAVELRHNLREEAPPVAGVWIRHYAGEFRVEGRGRIACDLRMEIANTTETAIRQVALALPFGLQPTELSSLSPATADLRFRTWGNILLADLDGPLAPGATTTIRLAYRGRPMALRIGQRMPFGDKYEIAIRPLDEVGVALGSKYLCITSWLMPRSVALVRDRNNIVPIDGSRLFTADLDFAVFGSLTLASPQGTIEEGQRTKDKDEATGQGRLAEGDGMTHRRLRITWPRSDFLVFAGPYERIERQYGSLLLQVYCFAANSEAVAFALDEYAETLERWGRLFGSPDAPHYSIVEVPSRYVPDDRLPPAAFFSTDLERLGRYQYLYEERENAGIMEFYRFQGTVTRALAATVLRESFHPDTEISSLRNALFFYLLQTVRGSELGVSAMKSPRIFSLRGGGGGSRRGSSSYRSSRRRGPPGGRHYGSRGSRPSSPSRGSGMSRSAFVRAELYETPLIERMALPGFGGTEARHVWQMLHYLLEDDKFAEFIENLSTDHRTRLTRLNDIRALAEQVYGEPLDWFFEHWFYGTGLPRYEVAEAHAMMVENERTREIEYDVGIVVANRGKGKMPVPVVIQTEGDQIMRKVWLDSGTTAALTLHVTDRPELVMIDPLGWITQEMPRERPRGSGGPGRMGGRTGSSRGPVQRRVRVIE